ncbi:MAG: hypothetical protein ACUVQU_04030 [Candidatus Bipolaricaulia bacterium]
MKKLGIGMILVMSAVIGGFLGESQDAQFAIRVSCPDEKGCFALIEEAIQQVSAGATIRVAPGVYYERPLAIEKSLRLEGIPPETGHYPRVILVEVGTAITIRAGSSLAVELERLSIEALSFDPFPSGGESIGIKVFSQTPDDVQIMLREVNIMSHDGISIAGDQPGGLTVEVVDTNIRAALVGIGMNMGRLILRGSRLRSPGIGSLIMPGIGIFMQPSPSLQIEALLTENHIEGFSIGLMATASSHLGQGRVDLRLVKNVIASNQKDGLYLLGDRVDVELSRNEIRGNGGYGLKLALPVCSPEGARSEFRFQGIIQGIDNEFSNNKLGALCPLDFPWPPNFIKNP